VKNAEKRVEFECEIDGTGVDFSLKKEKWCLYRLFVSKPTAELKKNV
jgi:hypothetical protein